MSFCETFLSLDQFLYVDGSLSTMYALTVNVVTNLLAPDTFLYDDLQ